MWPSNSKNFNNLHNRTITIDQNRNNINDHAPIYQTPIKQGLNVQGNSDTTPLQFDFNFYFGNLLSSGHIPAQYKDIPFNNSITQHNRETNLLLFKSSLEKSGYKLTPNSEIKNTNLIDYEITNNINNIYENELNQNEFTKKNLAELFNNAKNDEFLQSNKKGNNIRNNMLDNNNLYYSNNINNNINNVNGNILINQNNINQNINIKNNNLLNNMVYDERVNKENKNDNNNNLINVGIINQKYENKDTVNNHCILADSHLNNKNDKNSNNKGEEEEIFSSPINKKPKKIFECSGSTLATNSSKSSARKRRFRKNNEQLVLLAQFFNEHKHWSKKQIKEISQKTGLKENKVYKWLWDQRNKEYKSTKFIISKKDSP